MNRFVQSISAISAFLFLALLPQGCEKAPSDSLVSLEVRTAEVSADAGSQFVSVGAVGDWTLGFDGDVQWASVAPSSGNGDCRTVQVRYQANDSTEPRSLTLVLSNGRERLEAQLRQLGKAEAGTGGLNPDPVAGWLELPATKAGDGRYFFTHDMKVGKYSGRNYSFYLDAEARISVWVAYPLNKGLIGTGSRTNEWGLDPKVPRDYQPVIFKGMSGYERGHQLPSADRYAANVSTFYGTNITPQRGSLNEYAWATLEGYVRDWSYQFDTLYVVTGADINGKYSTARDNDGKKIAVPNGYFKALLGYRKSGTIGITGKTGGYTGIGFYFEHRAYEDSEIMGQSMTIDELEEKTGFDFFVNLPSKTNQSLADKVESTMDPWWKAY